VTPRAEICKHREEKDGRGGIVKKVGGTGHERGEGKILRQATSGRWRILRRQGECFKDAKARERRGGQNGVFEKRKRCTKGEANDKERRVIVYGRRVCKRAKAARGT
jgi:hypothetical protein